jgi:translation initiation factor 3 subunit M
VLNTLILGKPPERLSEFVTQIISHLTSNKEEKKVERLSNLSHMYNLYQDPIVKYNLLVAILEYARESDQTPAIECLFDTIDIRLNELSLSIVQKRNIYGLILKNIKDWQITYIYDYWIKYFSAFDSEEPIPAEIIEEAYNAIISILKDPEILLTEQLLTTKVILQLKAKKPAEKYVSCYKLLEIYTKSGYTELKTFQSNKTHQTFLNNSGINLDEITYKIRLLTLNSLAKKQSLISYDQIAKALEISEDDVEFYVIDATSSGILEARIDQLNQTIIIRYSPSRQFDKQQWLSLNEKLDKWKDNISHLLTVLRASKGSDVH